MPLPIVDHLRFARSEFVRALEGVSDEDARRRLEPMNCLSWIIGHLASQENGYWVRMAQGQKLLPELHKLVGYGSPPSTPPLDDMWDAWRTITAAADPFLDSLTADQLTTHFEWRGQPAGESIGTMLYRNIYHYWYHTGEASAIRQQLGHTDLPEFIGNMSAIVYRAE